MAGTNKAEKARVGVDQLVLVPHHGVPEDAGVAEEGEVGHVLGAVKLGRVDLADNILFEHLNLSIDIYRDLGSILGLHQSL